MARELGDFLLRFDRARELFRCAVADGRIVGSIALGCGEDPARAHLRWSIPDPALREQGLGRRWLAEAVGHARRIGMAKVWLWTLERLDAAARLHAEAGFWLDREIKSRPMGPPRAGAATGALTDVTAVAAGRGCVTPQY